MDDLDNKLTEIIFAAEDIPIEIFDTYCTSIDKGYFTALIIDNSKRDYLLFIDTFLKPGSFKDDELETQLIEQIEYFNNIRLWYQC